MADGRNCISTSFVTSGLTTDATSGTVGGTVHDTAHLTGATAGAGGTITFSVFGPRPLGSTPPDCSTLAFTSTVPVNGPGDYASGDFTPAADGQYDWTASYSGDGFVLGAGSPCGAANETSVVTASGGE